MGGVSFSGRIPSETKISMSTVTNGESLSRLRMVNTTDAKEQREGACDWLETHFSQYYALYISFPLGNTIWDSARSFRGESGLCLWCSIPFGGRSRGFSPSYMARECLSVH